MDLTELPLWQVIELLMRGETTPLELATLILKRIERLNPSLNCYLEVFSENALQEAERKTKAFSERRKLPPLYGIPMGIKDILSIKDVSMRAGSRIWEGYTPKEDAFVIRKLRNAGVIFIGQHNMHEIALGVTNVNPHFGACHNPWDFSRMSGGSSGGSAAAVASGLCYAALGTDTGGSIRIPSSLCGVVGLKPTYGRVSVRGVLPLSWNLDHVGPMGRSVRDVQLVYKIISGYDEMDVFSQKPVNYRAGRKNQEGLRGLRVALADDDFFREADEDILAAVRKAGHLFEQLGATVELVEIPNGYLAAVTNGQMVISDAAAVYEKELQERAELFGEDVLQRLCNGAALTSTQYIHGRKTQTILKKQFNDFFKKYDLLLTPSTAVTAPFIEGKDALEQARVLTRFTAPFNLTGLPAMSMPCGFDRHGLPVGLQLVTKAWNEELLFQAGKAYEEAAGWWEKRPPL